MRIGVPKEIKDQESRVGATPVMAQMLVEEGHEVLIETKAGHKSDFADGEFEAVGCRIVPGAKEVWQNGDMIIKVKEPQREEMDYVKPGQIIFSYLHLAAEPELVELLMEKKAVAIAYETVVDSEGRLPLLTPMSEIAGRLSVMAGAECLKISNEGRGVLLGGVPGVLPANVVIIGGGVVGTQAARMAMGLGADVTILDKNLGRLRELDDLFGPRLKTLYSSRGALEEAVLTADLVVGAVLVAGKRAPKLISREIVSSMHRGAVIVDVAIDQGGCVETSRPTTYTSPTFVEEEVVHYCVTNMPGAYPRTSTFSLTNATCIYAMHLARQGYKQAMLEDPCLRAGLNVCLGNVCNHAVAEDLGYNFHSPEYALSEV